MKTFYKIASWLLAILGGIHLSMTHVFYGKLSVSALWFAGTGLSLVFLGLLNYAALKAALSGRFSVGVFSPIF